MNGDTFEIYRNRSELVLGDLHGLGWCDTVLPRLGGPRTDGLDFLEIGYLHRGSIEWLTGEGLEEAGPGSVVIDWPGDWQGGTDAIIHPCERYWVRFDLDEIHRLPGLSPETSGHLGTQIARMKSRHFPASPAIKGFFDQILVQQRSPGLFAEEISRAAFHQILFTVVNDHLDDQSGNRSPAVIEALEYLHDHMTDDIRVGQVAQHVGLSSGYFHELFHREVGSTPARFVLGLRIARGRMKLVTSGISITELSMELGFSSSQYFATTFKKQVGLTPGDYRKLRRGLLDRTPLQELSYGRP